MQIQHIIAALTLLLLPGPVFAQSLVPAAVPVTADGNAQNEATAQMVEAIFNYTRWPNRPQPIRLCVLGPSSRTAKLHEIELLNGTKVAVDELSAITAHMNDCDALYLGHLPIASIRHATAKVRGRPVLTIIERDIECSVSEAMFCLSFKSNALSFQLNVDAVSRSPLRIDPRVLRLSKER